MTPAELAKQVRNLQITTRHLVTEVFAGEYSSAFKGRGIEFADVREYEPGDDIRAIDWNVTARTGRPFIKRFTEERELTVLLVVDCSASNLFSSVSPRDWSAVGGASPAPHTKQSLASEVAALIAFAAVKKGDHVGLQMFTDRVERYVPPRKGQNHALRIVRDLLAFDTPPEGRGTDLAAACRQVLLTQRRRAVVFIVSDFLGVDLEDSLRTLVGRHDVVALDIADPREHELVPAGLMTLADPETGEKIELDTSSSRVRAAYRDSMAALTDCKDRVLDRLGIDHVQLATDRPYVHELVEFFLRREARR